MVLQSLVSFVYSLVEASWTVSTVLAKYFLAAGIIYMVYKKENFIENYKYFLENFSREMVASIITVGLITLVTGFSINPSFTVLSHLTAVLLFGYFFWEF